jgi:hypothetical protein
LSTYASTVVEQPELEKEYNQIIDGLRMLPVHIFILQLEKNELEKRSIRPQRSSAWLKFQQQIASKNGFRDRLEKQQVLIFEAAKLQKLPYSVIKVPAVPALRDRHIRIVKRRRPAVDSPHVHAS